MSIRLIWDNEGKSVLRQQFVGSWNVDELYQITDRTRKLLDGLAHTVHIIIDARQSAPLPFNFLSAMRYVNSRVAPNQGEVIVVGANEDVRATLRIARRIAPDATRSGHFVESLREAYALLRERNPSVRIPA